MTKYILNQNGSRISIITNSQKRTIKSPLFSIWQSPFNLKVPQKKFKKLFWEKNFFLFFFLSTQRDSLTNSTLYLWYFSVTQYSNKNNASSDNGTWFSLSRLSVSALFTDETLFYIIKIKMKKKNASAHLYLERERKRCNTQPVFFHMVGIG